MTTEDPWALTEPPTEEEQAKCFARIGDAKMVRRGGGMATNMSLSCCLCGHCIDSQNGGCDVLCWWCLGMMQRRSPLGKLAMKLRMERSRKKQLDADPKLPRKVLSSGWRQDNPPRGDAAWAALDCGHTRYFREGSKLLAKGTEVPCPQCEKRQA